MKTHRGAENYRAVALLLAVLALEFYVIRMLAAGLAAGLVVLALLACG